MDGFYSFLFYGLIAVGAVLIISLTVLRIDWARHPEKYKKDVENYEKEQYWKKKKQDQEVRRNDSADVLSFIFPAPGYAAPGRCWPPAAASGPAGASARLNGGRGSCTG